MFIYYLLSITIFSSKKNAVAAEVFKCRPSFGALHRKAFNMLLHFSSSARKR
jgi:hypothetical protein